MSLLFKKTLFSSALAKLSLYAVQFLSLVVLSRLFSPRDIGSFYSYQIMINFFFVVGDFGVSSALINKSYVSSRAYSAFLVLSTVTALVSVFAFFLLILFYYGFGFSTIDFSILAAGIFFYVLGIFFVATLQKNLLFNDLAKIDIAAEIVSLLCVAFVLNFFEPVTVLSIKFLVQYVLKFFLLNLIIKRVVKIKFTLGSFGGAFVALRNSASYSFYFSLFNISVFFQRNLDAATVDKFFDDTVLGLYSRACNLVRYPLLLLSFSLNPAIQPLFVKIKSDNNEFDNAHDLLFRYLFFVGIFSSILMLFVSNFLVELILGLNWISVAPYLKILAVSLPAQVITGVLGGVFQAKSKTAYLFRIGLINLILMIFLLSLSLIFNSAVAIAYASSTCFCLSVFIWYYFINRFISREVFSRMKWYFITLVVYPVVAFYFVYPGRLS